MLLHLALYRYSVKKKKILAVTDLLLFEHYFFYLLIDYCLFDILLNEFIKKNASVQYW